MYTLKKINLPLKKCLRKRKQIPIYSFEISINYFEYSMHRQIDLSGIQLYLLVNFETEIGPYKSRNIDFNERYFIQFC